VAHGLTLPAVQALVAQGESQTLELKKSTAEKDRACCTLEELAQEFQGFEPPLFPVGKARHAGPSAAVLCERG
jgi:hypothetical protein